MVKAIRCGRCDTIASTRSWCAGSMRSIIEPQRRHSSSTFATAASSVPGGGVSSVQRPWNNVVKPASGPEYSVPATGCAGTKCTPAGTSGPTSRITDCLVEPTSVSTAPGARCGAMRVGEVGEGADRRAQHHAVGALHRARGVELDAVGEAELAPRGPASSACGRSPRSRPRGRRARGRCARRSCRSARCRAAPGGGTAAQPWDATEVPGEQGSPPLRERVGGRQEHPDVSGPSTLPPTPSLKGRGRFVQLTHASPP